MNIERIQEIIEEDIEDESELVVQKLLQHGTEELLSIIPHFDWERVKKELQESEWETEDDMERRSIYIGSVFDLAPSGKYYTAWANSNLEACPLCDGSGKYGFSRCNICDGFGKRGISVEDDVEKYEKVQVGDVCLRCEGKGYHLLTCPYCDGLGSHEAYLDEVFWSLFESEAEKHGLSIECGEGDPTDVFVVEYRER